MEKSLIEQCLDDTGLRVFIHRRAQEIAYSRPSHFDVEDAEQELWEALIRALPRYDAGVFSLHQFALSHVYSRYGCLSTKRLKNAEALSYDPEFGQPSGVAYPEIFTDRSFELVDAQLTLDQIESTLKHEASKGRQFALALSSIQLQRQGYTQS